MTENTENKPAEPEGSKRLMPREIVVAHSEYVSRRILVPPGEMTPAEKEEARHAEWRAVVARDMERHNEFVANRDISMQRQEHGLRLSEQCLTVLTEIRDLLAAGRR